MSFTDTVHFGRTYLFSYSYITYFIYFIGFENKTLAPLIVNSKGQERRPSIKAKKRSNSLLLFLDNFYF